MPTIKNACDKTNWDSSKNCLEPSSFARLENPVKQQKVLAERYAVALFEIGKESNEIDAFAEQLGQFCGLLNDNEELKLVFTNPAYTAEPRLGIVKELGGKMSWSASIINFLSLLVEKGRIGIIDELTSTFRQLSDDHNGRIHVTVTSAETLSEEYTKALTDKLQSQTGKQVTLHTQESQELMGGVVLQLGDKMLDNSIQSRLSQMKEQLLQELNQS
jgi:F-type H+-transporting ATPase subunit delta